MIVGNMICFVDIKVMIEVDFTNLTSLHLLLSRGNLIVVKKLVNGAHMRREVESIFLAVCSKVFDSLREGEAIKEAFLENIIFKLQVLSHCLPISIFFNYFDEISQHIRL
jgi:hypothetical protein